jgi:membrane fusion protein, heavy metal efflux system
MPHWIWGLATRAAAGVPTLLTLAALCTLALWGRSNNWQLSPSRAADQVAGKQASAEPAVKVGGASPGQSAADPVRVEFPSAAAVGKVDIRVVPARLRDLKHIVTAPGMLDYDPERFARLTARASGSVWRVYKEIGDPIRKGELLALLDAADVGRMKADLLRDLAMVHSQTTAVARLQKTYDGGSDPASSLQAAQTALREARVRLFNDQQGLLSLGLPVRLEELEKLSDEKLARRLRLLGLPEAVARDLDADHLTANLLPLTAPFDGQVVERNAATGEVVQTAMPKTLFVVGDIRQLHADLDVNPEDIAGVRVGQMVTFRPNDGGPDAVGRVSHLSPEVNAKTRRVQVHAEVPNEDRRLRPNTFGTGRIVVADRAGAVVVPAEAVQSIGKSGSLVFVRVSPTVFEARHVRLGLREGDLVEVGAVRAGEEVVTTGGHMLASELQKDRIGGGDE